MAGQPPPDPSWQPGQDNARAAWPQPEQPPYEPLAQTAKHPVPSFDPPPPGRPGPGYPPPRQEYAAGRPQGYSAGGPGYEAADQQASFDLPANGQQAAWQAPAQAQARPAAARGKGFLASLFDFGFTSFVTPKLVKALYVLATLWTALWALIQCIVATRASTTFCTRSLWEATQPCCASTQALGQNPPSQCCAPPVVARSIAG